MAAKCQMRKQTDSVCLLEIYSNNKSFHLGGITEAIYMPLRMTFPSLIHIRPGIIVPFFPPTSPSTLPLWTVNCRERMKRSLKFLSF